MKLLVIIVTYNAMRWAEHCFDSLRNSSVVPDVFVIDNGSTDGTQTYILENFPKTIFKQSKENLGFGAANNIGLRYALANDYDFVYLLNQDAWVMHDTFEKLIAISKKNPEYGLMSPVQMNSDMFHIDKKFCIGLFNYKNKDIINDIYNNKLNDIYETTPFIMAAHWFLTRDCIAKVGGFSPTFAHYGEDNNYADRIVYHRFKIGVAPLLKVVHDRGERVDTTDKIIFFWFIHFLVYLSNPLVNNRILMLVNNIVSCLKMMLKYKSLYPILYYCKILWKLPTIWKRRKESMIKDCAFLDNVKK